MIPDLGPHAPFIWSSYAIVFSVLASLTGWLIWDGNRQSRALAELDARSAKRPADTR
jgi:heme exporter protein CcmD